MANVQRTWDRLVSALGSWATVTRSEPGRIRVRFIDAVGSHRQVEIVMAPSDWTDWLDTTGESPEDTARAIRETLLDLDAEYRFLVYEIYGLLPSTTEALPTGDLD